MVDSAAPAADDLVPSQASSHFPLEPISADVLLRRETKRRDVLKKRGPVKAGCPGVDEYVLLGGLERGSVVGISAESEQIGLLLSMQALANELVSGTDSRAMVVTAQPLAAIVPILREAIKAELAALEVTAEDMKGSRLRSCLERVSVSRVFDLDGLWEVLGDLDIPPGSPNSEEDSGITEEDVVERLLPPPNEHGFETEAEPSERVVLPELKPGPDYRPKPWRTEEVADSDEEEAFSTPPLPPPSSSELSELSLPPSSMASMLATPEPHKTPKVSGAADVVEFPFEIQEARNALGLGRGAQQERPEAEGEPVEDQQTRIHQSGPRKEDEENTSLPDIILITHFSTLMTALFTRLGRTSAHDALQSLSDYLRYISRSLSTSPLIMLLNSSSSVSKNSSSTMAQQTDYSPIMQNPPAHLANDQKDAQPPPLPPPPPMDESPEKSSAKPIDQSLCSIFNPPPLDVHGYNSRALSRRNKPTFGLVFSQFLDVHLLCTKVPRTQEDGERLLFANSNVDDGKDVRFTWVIEVLLDELGVWGDEGSEGVVRKCREQRWTPVDVTSGRIVDALMGVTENTKNKNKNNNVGDLRVVGGFGGPRV